MSRPSRARSAEVLQHNEQYIPGRVLIAGTYSGHPVGVATALTTMERLTENGGEVYERLEKLGRFAQDGIEATLKSLGIEGTVVRQGSAFCTYFMDHAPRDWHDLASHHDFPLDVGMRRAMVDRGVFFFPVATKQCSISAAHTEQDIADTVKVLAKSLEEVLAVRQAS